MNSNTITRNNSKFSYFTLLLLFMLSVAHVSGQTGETFPHCNCTKIRTADAYKVISNNVVLEERHFIESKRDGVWISRDANGNLLRKVNHKRGNLDNTYESFYRASSFDISSDYFSFMVTTNKEVNCIV